jgi:hypothetical protein
MGGEYPDCPAINWGILLNFYLYVNFQFAPAP